MNIQAFLALLGSLLLLGIAEAQEPLRHQPPVDLHFHTSDLQFRTVDLQFRTVDLLFHTEDLKGAVQGLEVKETATEVKIELAGDILFDFDTWHIRPTAEPTLLQVAAVIKQHPRSKVLIEGHTDGKGSDTYNVPLSQKRADSVKAWLVKMGGINDKTLATKGWGKAKPVAPNTRPDGSDNPEGRQQNRRVEITVKK